MKSQINLTSIFNFIIIKTNFQLRGFLLLRSRRAGRFQKFLVLLGVTAL